MTMRLRYIGPYAPPVSTAFGTTDDEGFIDVPDGIAGRAPDPRLHAAMEELAAAVAAINHEAASVLRDEITGTADAPALDVGEGLLAQHETWTLVKASTASTSDASSVATSDGSPSAQTPAERKAAKAAAAAETNGGEK